MKDDEEKQVRLVAWAIGYIVALLALLPKAAADGASIDKAIAAAQEVADKTEEVAVQKVASLEPMRCVKCGCDDLHSCKGGCSWDRTDVEQNVGLCSQCASPEAIEQWDAGARD